MLLQTLMLQIMKISKYLKILQVSTYDIKKSVIQSRYNQITLNEFFSKD